ncbi:MAG: amphi-Trp domain-containing protein [Desulfarculales bacterium]|jgi:amphi-Trp domain-containing protein|nr:amphi-Trp domain-containing protein [Desulfarculales bacterium]
METEKRKLSMGKVMRLEEVIPYLQELITALKNGHITLNKSGEELVLRPRGELFLSIEAKVKKHSERFTLEMSWSNTDDEENKEETFVILSGAGMDKEEIVTPARAEIKTVKENKGSASTEGLKKTE